ncbi:hypothetical protein AA0119_g9683 [Alternaria tenuissima]|uniref:BZIP domain-containing protein n=1 Tax=Alternaria tenuissima TaxID=119927 RepID=A0AB37W2S4_9PLEO|nr:hypothetical protein B0T12DRAFT_488215 [Alternaria alternata]RYN17371.1 hypothetical protein AA0115_g11847 [Alternaria tenuissima]OWY57063.1 bzip transcription factor [Alternaria alternata]RYN54709.1 hypothetical protein AA0118_g9077 [Alternaria tenuissima]RYN80496.1 hypothetical protein AA0120_g10340 [Alternaria tenuissima]
MSSQDIPVPQGPDRKRVLNVLAQRRYRQRKRERLRSLETILQASSTNVAQSLNREGQLEHSTKPLAPEPCGTVKLGNNPLYDPFQDFGNTAVDPSFMSLAPYDMTFNPSAISSSYIGNQFGISPGLTYANGARSDTSTLDSQVSAELQDLETSQFTFPSDHIIDIPGLKTMEISLRIAQMLGLGDELLDLTIKRVLDVSKLSVPLEHLPENLRPTEAQLLLPHNPMIDVLPWPSVRTKLICLFSQPDQLRPPIARGSMAIMRLLYSIDDESEGLRVVSDANEQGIDVKGWEVGQAVFKDWWWILDPEIVSNSNRLRNMRGAPKLEISIP